MLYCVKTFILVSHIWHLKYLATYLVYIWECIKYLATYFTFENVWKWQHILIQILFCATDFNLNVKEIKVQVGIKMKGVKVCYTK